MKKILVATSNASLSLPIVETLSKSFVVDLESDLETALARFRQFRYEYFFIETEALRAVDACEDKSFSGALKLLRKHHPLIPIVVFSSASDHRLTVQAVLEGANDYLIEPFQSEDILVLTKKFRSKEMLTAELDYFKDEFWNDSALDVVITKNPAMMDIFNKVKSVAKTSSTVLLTGETGVGKSLVAKMIHEHSSRSQGNFVSVHCGAIPENLVESELFGHEKGSFTGAIKRKLGRFEIANNGTIFLDEIGTVSPSTQIKLLQVLQESTFQRVGGESDIKVDVRIIAATNENLKDLAEHKEFRSDLFYRLNVFPIHIPPLRERKEDIPFLCEKFLNGLNKKYSKNINSLSELAAQALKSYSWPGNIRELENVIERAYIIERSEILSAESLPLELNEQSPASAIVPMNASLTLAETRNQAIEDVERQYLKQVLEVHGGKINETAATAGVTPRQIHKLMTKYGLDKKDFKGKSIEDMGLKIH